MYFDSAVIRAGEYGPGETLATFFHDDGGFEGPSITEKPEPQLVSELFGDQDVRNLIFHELALPKDSIYDTHVVQPLIDNPQAKPGDIDVLICERDKPNQAIAVECKRVKVVAASTFDDDLNKIQDIKDGAIQTRELRRMQFNRTFLAVLIQVDGRKRKDFNTVFRGLNPRATFDGSQTTLKRIYEFPQSGIFHDDVGFIFIEVIQPTGKPFERMGGVCLRIERQARAVAQPDSLTNRISHWISTKTK